MRWSFLKNLFRVLFFLTFVINKVLPYLRILFTDQRRHYRCFCDGGGILLSRQIWVFERNLFFALVIAYIFKDRFKEIVRDWLSNVIFRRWIPDRRLFIFMGKKKVGCAKENFGFVSLKELPIGSKDIFKGITVCYRKTSSILS